jgi:hypothetical protein
MIDDHHPIRMADHEESSARGALSFACCWIVAGVLPVFIGSVANGWVLLVEILR